MSEEFVESSNTNSQIRKPDGHGVSDLWQPKLGLTVLSFCIYLLVIQLEGGFFPFWMGLSFLVGAVLSPSIVFMMPLLLTIVFLYGVTLYLARLLPLGDESRLSSNKKSTIFSSLVRALAAGIPALALAAFYVFVLKITTLDLLEIEGVSANPAVFLRNIIIVTVSIVMVRLLMWLMVRAKSFSGTEKYLRGIY